MEAVPEAPAPATQGSIFSLARFTLILIPTLGFLGYYAPYVMGLAYHQHLLSLYGIPTGLFESEPRQLFMYAYEAILVVFGHWRVFITTNWYVIPGVFLSILLFTSELLLITWLNRKRMISDAIDRTVKSKWLQILILLLIFSTAITTLFVLLPIALAPVIGLPALIGGYGAELTFEKAHKLYEGGCGAENAQHIYCKAVRDRDSVLGVGFLVLTSDSRIALYQPKHTKILSLRDATIEVMPPEDFKRYEASLQIP